MRVFVAGGTSVIGQRLVPMLFEAGHTVAAMTRSRARAHQLSRRGVEPVVCDVYDESALTEALASFAPEVVINQLAGLPQRLHSRHVLHEMGATNRLRTEGVWR